MATRESTAVSTDLKITIERMTEHDLLEVVQLEEVSGLSAWGWDAYHKELQSPKETLMLVARSSLLESSPTDTKPVVGFIVARLIADECHINNVAIVPKLRKHGIGASLLETALKWGRRNGAALALLEVRAGNTAAQALYGRCGFKVTGRRRRYYRAPVEDALLMSVSLKEEP